jgi:hypothetical protein
MNPHTTSDLRRTPETTMTATAHRLTLDLLPGTFAVCRLATDAPVPAWTAGGPLVSVTRTADELSVVCGEDAVPGDVRCEPGWRCLRLAGPIPFTAVGVLASLLVPLADAGVAVFAVSTFDTDYVLVKDWEPAVEALRSAGHEVNP